MAKAEVVVTFSSQDRQLLRDIRDALRKQNRDRDGRRTRRLVEEQQVQDEFGEGVVPQEAIDLPSASTVAPRRARSYYCGNGPAEEWDYTLLDDHIVADTKGYTWNGQGWVPKG